MQQQTHTGVLGSLHQRKTVTHQTGHNALGGFFTHKPRHKSQIHKTITEEEYVPGDDEVSYMLNGKKVSEAEFLRLQAQGHKVQSEKVEEAPLPSPKRTEKMTYHIDGKEVSQEEYEAMKAAGLVE